MRNHYYAYSHCLTNLPDRENSLDLKAFIKLFKKFDPKFKIHLHGSKKHVLV